MFYLAVNNKDCDPVEYSLEKVNSLGFLGRLHVMTRRKAGLRLHQVLLQVKDVERSRDFYTKKLGFKVLYDFSPNYLAILTPNKLQIGFHPFRGSSRRPGIRDQTAGIEFEVDNVDFWYRTLRKRGIKFSQKPKDFWGEREARFADPDGYRLAISSPAKKSSE